MTEKATNNIGLLLRCYEAVRNWRAMALMASGAVLGVVLLAAAAAAAAKMGYIAGLLLALVALLVYLAGINGAGLLLVDQADNKSGRDLAAAFFGGLHATLTSVLAMLLLGLGLVAVFIVLFILSLLGKIPGIGPLFAFLLAGPSAIVLAFCYGVLVIGTPLMLVAVWRGEGVLGSLGRAVDIVVKRPLDALLHFILLAVIVAPVVFFVLLLMIATSGVTIGMYASSSLFGGGGMDGFGGYGSPVDQLMSTLASSAHQMGAASASLGIVIAVLVALFMLVQMLGYVMVYDSLSEGLASTAADRLRGSFDQIKQKVEQHRPQTATAPAAATCKSCGARLSQNDQFCGECGQRT